MNPLERVTGQAFAPEHVLGPLNDVERRHAPERVYLSGFSELLRERHRVAVVGARDASDIALRRARRLAHELAAKDICVVSGLARGIDTAAHTAAIERGGRTIAVIGTPLDQCNPKSNERLQREIATQHLVVSQFPLGQPVHPSNFVLRNRTMALISHASVIVEAGEGSGSLSQGWEMLRLGRLLFLMKSVIDNPSLEWPRKMMEYGAQVLERTEDLLEQLPELPSPEPLDAPF
jgi:DNA processing protein